MGPGVSFQAKRLGKELLKVCLRHRGCYRLSSDEHNPSLPFRLRCLGLHLEDSYRTNNLAAFKIKESLPAGITLVSADDLETWYLDVQVLDANPLYLDKTFRLLFRFGDQYPIGMDSFKFYSTFLYRLGGEWLT